MGLAACLRSTHWMKTAANELAEQDARVFVMTGEAWVTCQEKLDGVL